MGRYDDHIRHLEHRFAGIAKVQPPPPAVVRRFKPFLENHERIEVDIWGDGKEILRGTVGMTGGWMPAFLLMRTTRSMGSPWILDERSVVRGVVRNSRLVPPSPLGSYPKRYR